MAVVTGQAVVLKGTNGLGILLGSGPPDSTVGVDGQPGYLDTTNNLLYGPRVNGAWPSTGYQFGGNLVLTVGAPSNSVGMVGNLALDINQGFIYGPRTSSGWPANPALALVGPQGIPGPTGPAATFPKEITGNSLIIAPVSGDTNTVQILLQNSSGTTLFGVTASGNVSIAGTLNVTGNTTVAALVAASLSVSGNASVGGTLSVTGAMTIAALTSTGLITAANMKLSSGGILTFADGTTMSTAATGSGAGRSIIHMGQITNSSINANAYYGLFQVNVDAKSSPGVNATIYGWAYKFPFAGSVTSYQCQQNIAAGANGLQYYKNGNSIATFSVGSGAGNFYSTHAKGTYSFAAGDSLTCATSIGTGTSTAIHVLCTIDWT